MLITAKLTFAEAVAQEWWLTNGIGGFAAGTLAGCLTRRYHGLLTAGLPSGARRLFWAKLETTVKCGDRQLDLATNEFSDGTMHPTGYRHLLSAQVDSDSLQRFYAGQGLIIAETITMVPGVNATLVEYEVVTAPAPVELVLIPLVNQRDYHEITLEQLPLAIEYSERECLVRLADAAERLALVASRGEFLAEPDWYYNFHYRIERCRGLSDQENHFRPGRFRVVLAPGERVQITGEVLSGQRKASGWQIADILERRRQRKKLYHAQVEAYWQRYNITRQKITDNEQWLWRRLLTLADAARNFIVQIGNRQDIIAGYPWFTSWGRDTMISLPGLCLVTGEHETARQILLSYAEHIRGGLLPNRFQEDGGAAYNTVDASLWFVVAVYHYLRATEDHQFLGRIWPAINAVIRAYLTGTEYNIRATSLGLIFAGSPGVQLTWMDAKVGEWVVTPRHGCPVEINALWYNSLQIAALLAGQVGRSDLAFRYEATAELVQQSFAREFWNDERGCLYDLILPDGQKDPAIRPNQILAVSLPFPLLSRERSRQVVQRVFEHLYTPGGLRTLAPGEPEYRPRFAGPAPERDAAYHQGTAWPWLTGQFIKAYLRVADYAPAAVRAARLLLNPLVISLAEAGLGYISEIMEPEYPFAPRGCPAQAWSVAEVLRAYVEDILPYLPVDQRANGGLRLR